MPQIYELELRTDPSDDRARCKVMQAIGRCKLGVTTLLLTVAACGGGAQSVASTAAPAPPPPAPVPPPPASPGQLRDWLSVLAADSLMGRATGTPGGERAARLIAEAMREMELRPAGDSGYYQRVPLFRGARGLVLADSLPGAEFNDVNVVGILPGSDSVLGRETVIVGAHYDHLGIGPAVAGDSIYNGADDDGSGVIATLAIARALTSGPPLKRTIVFLLTTGEEVGLIGTRWYVAHPIVPLDRTVADLQIEMIGRPDPLVGGPGIAWLTGYERSTMGDIVKRAGLPIAPDARPMQRFFERSDNIAFALLGIPAHTISSYGMHTDYHTPADEVAKIDFPHMARVVEATARLVRLLADGPKPEWHPGGRPRGTGESGR